MEEIKRITEVRIVEQSDEKAMKKRYSQYMKKLNNLAGRTKAKNGKEQ